MTLITPGGAIPAPTRQNIVGQGVVSAAGVCVITFNPPPMGYTLTGTIAIYDSPSAASWQVALSGTVIDITSGASSIGNIQIQGADVLTLTAKNLLPFAGQTFHANFTALAQQDEYVTPIIPSHDSLVLPSTYDSTVLVNDQVVNGNGGGTANFVISGLSIATKYLKIYWTSVSVIDTSVIITGNTTGIIYTTVPFIETFGPITNPQGGFIDVYVESALDTAVTVTFPQLAAGQAITVWVAGSPISPLAHIDDGQIVPVNPFPAGQAVNVAAVSTTTANVPVALLGGPPGGKVRFLYLLTIFNINIAGVVEVDFLGASSSLRYARDIMAAAGAVNSIVNIPLMFAVSEPIQVVSSVTGQVNYAVSYADLTAV